MGHIKAAEEAEVGKSLESDQAQKEATTGENKLDDTKSPNSENKP